MFIHIKPRHTVKDLLVLLSIGSSRLYYYFNSGALASYTIGKRRFVSPVELDKYIARCEQAAKDGVN